MSADADPPPDVAEVVSLWNTTASKDFGRIVAVGKKRIEKVRAARRVLPNLEDWKVALERLNAWPFAHGQNDTGWKAGFDYLLSNDKHGNMNLLQLAEGAKGGPPKQTLGDLRTKPQRAEDSDWSNEPIGRVEWAR
jgi:hypothetical protein